MQKIRIAPAGGAPPAPALASNAKPQKRPMSLDDEKDGPSVLVFVRGSFCSHCMSQIIEMDKSLAGRGVKVSVITASAAKDLELFPNVSFDLIADPELKLFKRYGAFDGKAKHATIVRDRGGKELLRKVGEAPFADTGVILAALRLAEPQFVIAVANTDTVDDDYVTWAPTPCRIRIANPVAGGADVTVTLTNNSAPSPEAGQVRFAGALAAGKTATDATLTLTVKGDGTPTDFFIAGSKASTLTTASLANKGRDAVIEIHKDNAAGAIVGQQAVMVRVRKDFAATNAIERNALQSAIAQLHTAPPGGQDFYLLMLQIHSLSVTSPGSPRYPNQAHNGPAFLAWHRAYILRFERELQKLDPTVSLHYWRMNQQPGPGLPAAVFDSRAWGSNSIGPGVGPVTFDPANPLFGWQINGELLSRGRTSRANISIFIPENSVLNYDAYRDDDTGNGFSENLEIGNHNNGHGWVGSWMADCQRSPRDPIFWLFHCDLDRSWALWQWTKGRFGTTGANASDYAPNDAYTPGSFNAKGHHLKDTMWPWDGITGPGGAGDPSSDRPPMAPGGAFPKALLPGIWPPADAKPRPSDMIDYLGIEDRVHNLGFCYDAVPYGTSAVAPKVTVAPAVAFDTATSWTDQRVAVQSLNPRKAEAKAKLLDIVKAVKRDDALRIEALHRLVRAGVPEGFDAALAIVRDSRNGGPALQLATINALGEMCMFARVSDERHHDAEIALAEVVKTGEDALRHAAIENLAIMQAPSAPALLREQLVSKNPWLAAPEAIQLLRVAAPNSVETVAVLKRHLDSPEPATQALAILGLAGDEGSRARRREFLLDADAPTGVRSAALQSLMHSDPSFPDAALRVTLDVANDITLRREALAGLAVYARGNSVGKEKLTAWIGQLRSLEAAPQKALRTTATPIIQSLEKLAASR
jgi:peroxiredoxin